MLTYNAAPRIRPIGDAFTDSETAVFSDKGYHSSG